MARHPDNSGPQAVAAGAIARRAVDSRPQGLAAQE